MVEDCPFIFFAPAPHSIVDGLQAFPQFGQGILHPRERANGVRTLIIEGLTPPQERLLKAIPNYAVTWAKKAGLTEIAEDIEKHYEISPGIQKHIDELTPKPKRNKSYGHSL